MGPQPRTEPNRLNHELLKKVATAKTLQGRVLRGTKVPLGFFEAFPEAKDLKNNFIAYVDKLPNKNQPVANDATILVLGFCLVGFFSFLAFQSWTGFLLRSND